MLRAKHIGLRLIPNDRLIINKVVVVVVVVIPLCSKAAQLR